MNTTDIFAHISTGLSDGMSRDEVTIGLTRLDLDGKGITLNKATDLVKQYYKDNGLSTAPSSHKADALADLDGRYGGEAVPANEVSSVVVDLTTEYGVAESTARDYIKAYHKANGVSVETVDPRIQLFDWLKDNQSDDLDVMKEEFHAFAKSIGRSRSNANEYWKGYELHLYLTK